MDSTQILITGMGVISCIGDNTKANLDSLIHEKSGISDIKHLETFYKGILPAGEINYSTKTLAELAGIDKSEQYSRSTLLAILAASEAIQQANLSIPEFRTGLISSTTVGGMDQTEKHFNAWANNPSVFQPHFFNTHDCGDSTLKLAAHFGITEFCTTISTACSSAANAILLGARLIKNNQLDRVIVGGTDALTRFTLNGFNTLLILDKEKCTPFDENRRGLNLGEGAAYLVLESEKAAKGKNVYAKLSGYGNANDAFHQTASSPEGKGAILAMTKALSVANISPSEIDYINVHGTGTPNNDSTEGLAIETIFKNKIPPYSSTKSYTGHTLAACGAIEAIYAILALNNGLLYPNLRFKEKIKELSTEPITQLKKDIKINHVLSNSFGFGGNNSSLILSSYEN